MKKKTQGVTIIELVAVMFILGLIFVVVTESFNGIILSSEDQTSKIFVDQDITFFTRKLTNDLIGASRLIPPEKGTLLAVDFFLDKVVSIDALGNKLTNGKIVVFRARDVESTLPDYKGIKFKNLEYKVTTYQWMDLFGVSEDNDGKDGIPASDYRKDKDDRYLDVDNKDGDNNPYTNTAPGEPTEGDLFDDDGFPDDLGAVELKDGTISKTDLREIIDVQDWRTYFTAISPLDENAYIYPTEFKFTFYDARGIQINDATTDLSTLPINELNEARTVRVTMKYRRRTGIRLTDDETTVSFVINLGNLGS